jgi:uncharacterized membrane protein HdeD (DUF308 family)
MEPMVTPQRGLLGRLGLPRVDYENLRQHRGEFIALGLALVVLGAFAILMPFFSSVVTTVAIGSLLLLGGIALAIHALVNRKWAGSGWEIVSAIIYVIAGWVVVTSPISAKLVLTLVLSMFLIVEGIAKAVRALQHKDTPAWGWLLFDGIVSLILGIIIWRGWPGTAFWVLGIFVGIELVLNGSSLMVLGMSAGRAAKAPAAP